jgi:hypothetical protein
MSERLVQELSLPLTGRKNRHEVALATGVTSLARLLWLFHGPFPEIETFHLLTWLLDLTPRTTGSNRINPDVDWPNRMKVSCLDR